MTIEDLIEAVRQIRAVSPEVAEDHIVDADKMVQEPVACRHNRYSVDAHEQTGTCYDCGAEGRMRFVVDDTHQQPKREWIGLTDDEIDAVTDAQWATNNHKTIYAAHRAYARAIEAKIKEKNT